MYLMHCRKSTSNTLSYGRLKKMLTMMRYICTSIRTRPNGHTVKHITDIITNYEKWIHRYDSNMVIEFIKGRGTSRILIFHSLCTLFCMFISIVSRLSFFHTKPVRCRDINILLLNIYSLCMLCKKGNINIVTIKSIQFHLIFFVMCIY